MRLNQPNYVIPPRTHEGAPAAQLSTLPALRRSVLACLLWEDQFYEDGVEIATRITQLAEKVTPNALATLAIEARRVHHLRHVPLLLLSVLARTGKGQTLVSDAIYETLERADELAEFLAVYAKVNGVPLNAVRKKVSAQAKKGLARAFAKFDAYQLAKYNRDGGIKLRDVAFMAHPKPRTPEETLKLAKLVNKSFFPSRVTAIIDEPFARLDTADTWETALSTGADIADLERDLIKDLKKKIKQIKDMVEMSASMKAVEIEKLEQRITELKAAGKKASFERLLRENKLGYMALLRNLRNMVAADVDLDLIREKLQPANPAKLRVLPFRFTAAARACPQLEEDIDKALVATVNAAEPLPGKTVVLVDVSGSMDEKLSGKSDLKRIDAAATLASVIPGNSGNLRVFTFSEHLVEVPARRGMAGVDAVIRSQTHSGTYLGRAIDGLNKQVDYERLIVVTDEQSHDRVPPPKGRAYLINVASYKHGVGYKPGWIHIDGFSEAVLRYIATLEREEQKVA